MKTKHFIGIKQTLDNNLTEFLTTTTTVFSDCDIYETNTRTYTSL